VSRARAERIALDRLPARPWKNGGGATREIAALPAGAGIEDFEWRLSLAEVAQDGPFSAFPGVDRQILLWRGAGLQLRDGVSLDHRLDRPGVPFAFDGAAPISAALLGGPTLDLNVMTRRGRWRAQVSRLDEAASIDSADAALLLCGAGTWRIAGEAEPLTAGTGGLWREGCGSLTVEPVDGGDAWLVAVRLCHDRES
jgi:environmental stress-induced protein Ves